MAPPPIYQGSYLPQLEMMQNHRKHKPCPSLVKDEFIEEYETLDEGALKVHKPNFNGDAFALDLTTRTHR